MPWKPVHNVVVSLCDGCSTLCVCGCSRKVKRSSRGESGVKGLISGNLIRGRSTDPGADVQYSQLQT
jgi:hypothetical protein